ncbi:MAG: helix-turn-helix transcriptional regulator [Elusimicrobia bacterium]|nr:helix-turn-helix transcriptional regulator [Elusimicrobiota bacterium]
MKREKPGVPLDEVFSPAEKSPGWDAAYKRAGLEVRLAVQIASARARARMTQKELARAVGTTQSVISRIERAEQNLTLATLEKLAKALDADLSVGLRPRSTT